MNPPAPPLHHLLHNPSTASPPSAASPSASTSNSYATHLFHARRPDPAHVPSNSRFATSNPSLLAPAATKTTSRIMPRPQHPPTPASSSDLRGKDGANLSAPTFNLPPTAFQPDPTERASASTTPSAHESDSSYRPVSPPSPANNMSHGKRAAAASGPVITKDDFALPPPPTRSRKIIQMKPKDATNKDPRSDSVATSPNATTKGQTALHSGAGKKKQSNASTTAAGRKIARKTAHSLIERRRRSKMNEEFGVLKDMIPACQGQEMHKLAILQASIDYLRYLEQCVTDLQAQNKSPRTQPPPVRRAEEAEHDDEDEDEEMEDNEPAASQAARTPTTSAQDASYTGVSLPPLSQITAPSSTTSPIFSQQHRNYSISSASQASYSPYFHSNQTSPAFGPQMTHAQGAPLFSSTFGLGSPALGPIDSSNSLRQIAETASDRRPSPTSSASLSGSTGAAAGNKRRSEQELDHEATAALLMLNSDRRNWRGSQAGPGGNAGGSGGMSVRDLLSG